LAALQNLVAPVGGNTTNPAIAGAAPQAATSLESILSGSPQDLQSYFKTNVFDPLNQAFQQDTLPAINSAMGASLGGPQSTAAADSVARATNNFENTLAATQGDLAYRTAQQDITNKLTAASALPGVANQPLQQLMTLLGAGGTVPGLEQQNVTNQLQGFQDVSGNTQKILGDLIAFLGQQTLTPANQNIANGGSSGAAGGLMQGAGSILSALAIGGVLSDRRLKTDIKRVGELKDGTPIYRYRYKGTPNYHIGVMADEVERKYPEAVSKGDYKTVHYGILSDVLEDA